MTTTALPAAASCSIARFPSRTSLLIAAVCVLVAAGSSRPALAAIPAEWDGQVVIDNDVPRFFPVPAATLAAKATATVPIKTTLLGVSGTGEQAYDATSSVGQCTGRSTGKWDVTITGTATAPPMSSLSGKYLHLTIAKTSGEFVHTVTCPSGGSPPVKQTTPASTIDMELPVQDGAQKNYLVQVGTMKFASNVTLHLPCAWDSLGPEGPAVEFLIDDEPVKGFDFSPLFPRAFDETLTRKQLADRTAELSQRGGTAVRAPGAPGAPYGATEVPSDFANQVDVQFGKAKVGAGVCVWVNKVSFKLPKGRQFISQEVAQSGKPDCIGEVKTHEEQHATKDIVFFAKYARKLDTELRKFPGPPDALLNTDDSEDIAEIRLRTDVTSAINRIGLEEAKPYFAAPSPLDSEAASAAARKLCGF